MTRGPMHADFCDVNNVLYLTAEPKQSGKHANVFFDEKLTAYDRKLALFFFSEKRSFLANNKNVA